LNKINKKQKIVLIFVSIFIVCIAYYINTSQQKENIINSEDTVEENKINTEEEKIVVHISGAVNKEGVIEILSTARIKDAIEMAGGVKENADLTNINLAQVLEDGVKIYIPIKEEQVLEEKTSKNVEVNNIKLEDSNKTNIVNINTANQTQLETLPGIGASTALKIINYRKQNGKFNNIEDIKQVSGIGESKFNKIKNFIKVK
jgi:competence protein ComEA